MAYMRRLVVLTRTKPRDLSAAGLLRAPGGAAGGQRVNASQGSTANVSPISTASASIPIATNSSRSHAA